MFGNRLKLNEDKTNVIWLHSRQHPDAEIATTNILTQRNAEMQCSLIDKNNQVSS